MASININTVANHLSENNWKLISDFYKNLDTELEMKCPNGHIQKQTYKKWRKNPVCEICLDSDPFKGKKNSVPEKKSDTMRILALDAATIITGYAIYDNNILVSYGTFKATKTKEITERINEVKHWLLAMIKKIKPDFIGIENIQLEDSQVDTYQKLARLQGVILDVCLEEKINCDLVYATQWRKYCNVNEGVGREHKKKQAQKKVKLWYNRDCTQDEADAICIGKYFCNYIKKYTSSWGDKNL